MKAQQWCWKSRSLVQDEGESHLALFRRFCVAGGTLRKLKKHWNEINSVPKTVYIFLLGSVQGAGLGCQN